MQNDPRAKPHATRFEARQPDAGATPLLFFVEEGSMFLAREVLYPAHGWQRQNLSAARIAHGHAHGRCTDFASALSVPVPGRAQAIHLAMVVNDGKGEHLYLSLSNPAANLLENAAWCAAPLWTPCPFDAGPPARLAITKVQIGDASDRAFVVVDAVIDPDGVLPRRARYSIDVDRTMGSRWIEHRLPIDAGAGVTASCLGRCRGGWDVDGLYLAGRIDGEAQLLYAPLYNPFNPMQPRWARHLDIPGKAAADAIAACRNQDNTSDLYVAANGALYYFSASNQNEGAQALALGADPAFQGMRTLFASSTGGRVTVWGVNGAGQVVCTSAPQVAVADPAAWRVPSAILSNVEAIAPAPDGDGADYVFFARTAGEMVKVSSVPGRSLWVSHGVGRTIN
jgi:hypothetical protein